MNKWSWWLRTRGIFFFLSLLSLPGFMGVPLLHPAPSFQEPTGPNPSRSAGLPSLFCLEGAESAACLAQSTNPACYCLWGRSLSQGWRDQKDIFTPRQFCFVCLIILLWLWLVLRGLEWRGGEEVGQKKGSKGRNKMTIKKLWVPTTLRKIHPPGPRFPSIFCYTHTQLPTHLF